MARGGTAFLRSCFDPVTGRTVAVKSLLAETRNDPRERRRLLREARVTAQLQHPNTVPVYDIGDDLELGIYFVMKRISGENLFEILKRIARGDEATIAAYPLARRLEILADAFQALSYAHVRGVIHRDVKPENIWVGNFGEVILLDWGVAKVWGHADDNEPINRSVLRNTSKDDIQLADADRRRTTTGDAVVHVARTSRRKSRNRRTNRRFQCRSLSLRIAGDSRAVSGVNDRRDLRQYQKQRCHSAQRAIARARDSPGGRRSGFEGNPKAARRSVSIHARVDCRHSANSRPRSDSREPTVEAERHQRGQWSEKPPDSWRKRLFSSCWITADRYTLPFPVGLSLPRGSCLIGQRSSVGRAADL